MNRVIKLISDYAPRDELEAADREQMLTFMRASSGWLTRENPVAHVTASAWIVDPDRKNALMIYHNIYRSWSWTGGHADGDGDLMAVAMREAAEETGVQTRPVMETPVSIESGCVAPHVKRGRHVSAHIHMNATFLLEADISATLRIKPDENSGVRWIPFDQINAHVTEDDMRPIYAKLMARARVM